MAARDDTLELVPVLDLGNRATIVAIGDRYGRLVITSGPLGHTKPGKKRVLFYECRCDCGTVKTYRFCNLRSGAIRSCRCWNVERIREVCGTHGCKPRRLHGVWSAMLRRCSNRNVPEYMNYGARGIQVCPEWRSDFVAFRAWAFANGYRPGLTIERNGNDGDYSPANCRWATKLEQAHNKRNNRRVTAFGETKVMAQWATDPRCPVSAGGIQRRLTSGWSEEQAVSAPKFSRRRVTDE